MKRIDYQIYVGYFNKILHKGLYISIINFLTLKKLKKKNTFNNGIDT